MTQAGTGGDALVRQLGQLAELHSGGALDGEEFTLAKRRLLGRGETEKMVPVASAPATGTAPTPSDPARSELARSELTRSEPAQSDPDAPLSASERAAGAGAEATDRRQRVQGATVVAGCGALVTIFAFFVMPMATVPLLGSLTGVGLAGYASEIESLALLWLVPLAAAAVAGISGWRLTAAGSGSDTTRTASITSCGLAAIACIVYLTALGRLQSTLVESGGSSIGIEPSSIIGAGFWFGLLGALVALVASVAAIAAPVLPDER